MSSAPDAPGARAAPPFAMPAAALTDAIEQAIRAGGRVHAGFDAAANAFVWAVGEGGRVLGWQIESCWPDEVQERRARVAALLQVMPAWLDPAVQAAAWQLADAIVQTSADDPTAPRH